MKNITYQLVVMGATGFTGRLVVEYLIKNYGIKNNKFTWAIAGRNKKKLEDLRLSFKDLHPDYNQLHIFVVDSTDSLSLDAMTSNSALILSTVGPYIEYGIPLVESCVKNSTHYCDLTGETPFIRESIDLFDQKAKENNCRIIHSCGFDSIPSDIGVLLLQMHSVERFKSPCDEITLCVKSMRGGFSGGTVDSMINISRYMNQDSKYKSILKSPFALNPKEYLKNDTYQPNLKSVKWSNNIQRWICPFIMAGINTKIVRRSNAIMNNKYGYDFRYSEVYTHKKFSNALIMFTGLILIQIFIKFRPLLWILRKLGLPKPGEGPSKKQREDGFFQLNLFGSIKKTKKISLNIIGDSDPGYSATAKMITEAALSILLDEEKIPKAYGVLTPAAGIGSNIVNRLEDKGICFNLDK